MQLLVHVSGKEQHGLRMHDHDRFVLPEGTSKVVYASDTKLENSGTFTMLQEDHTIGNLLRMQLHADKHVLFAGYRIPHPLETRMLVRVQTTGVKTPVQAVEHALEDLRSEVQSMMGQFHEDCMRVRSDHGMMG
jgi:DNA-directed RNA polymerase II subunit RPB11